MKVAFGLKAHSGWAVLVVMGEDDNEPVVVDRRRLELVEEEWARQPYHAAEELKPEEARNVIQRGIDAACRIAAREIRAAVRREEERKNEVSGCAVLVTDPMPDWGPEEILSVHVRMHKAEGVLFRNALARAATGCGLRLVAIPERQLARHAENRLGIPAIGLEKQIARLGKSVGPPWRKDQRDSALAALVALARGNQAQ